MTGATIYVWFEPGWKKYRAGRSTKDKVYGVGGSVHDAFWDYLRRSGKRSPTAGVLENRLEGT